MRNLILQVGATTTTATTTTISGDPLVFVAAAAAAENNGRACVVTLNVERGKWITTERRLLLVLRIHILQINQKTCGARTRLLLSATDFACGNS